MAQPIARPITATHCAAHETVYFQCATASKKVINLCGVEKQTLQYRFGPPGKIELAYPANAASGWAQLQYAHYQRYQTSQTEVSFSNNAAQYTVFKRTEFSRVTAGVQVSTTAAGDKLLQCRGKVITKLEALEALPCDPDNALNLGACKPSNK